MFISPGRKARTRDSSWRRHASETARARACSMVMRGVYTGDWRLVALICIRALYNGWRDDTANTKIADSAFFPARACHSRIVYEPLLRPSIILIHRNCVYVWFWAKSSRWRIVLRPLSRCTALFLDGCALSPKDYYYCASACHKEDAAAAAARGHR